MNQLSELSKGLIAHFPLSEAYPAIDVISNIVGTATDVYNVLDRQGSGRRSLGLNGTSDYVTLPTIPAFGVGDFTVILKIGITQLTNSNKLLSGATNSFSLYVQTNGKLYSEKTNVSTNVSSNTVLTLGDYTIVYKRSGTSGTYYINGVADNTVTDNFDYSVVCDQIGTYAGVNNSAQNVFMLRIFNYALSPTQIANYSKPEYPIEWVDRGATGTNLCGDPTMSNNGWWTADSPWSIAGGVASVNGVLDLGTGTSLYRANLLELTKKYRASFTISSYVSGSIQIWPQSTGVSFTSNGSIDFTCSNTYFGFNRDSLPTTTNLAVDNVLVTQLGCVLDLNTEGLTTSGHWYDKTNSADATVSGATLVIPPASNLSATSFNGSTSKVIFTDGVILGSGDFSCSANILLTANQSAGGGYIFGGSAGAFAIGISVDRKLYVNKSDITAVGLSGTVLNLYQWYSVVYTRSAGKGKIFINGINTDTWDDTQNYTVKSANISSYLSGGSWFAFFIGLVSDVSVWKESLDLDRIKLLNDSN